MAGPARWWKAADAAGRIDDPAWSERVDERPPRSRRRVVVSTLAAVLLAMAAVGVAGVATYNRSRFGRWAFWALPYRVDYCGRRYYPSNREISGTPAGLTAQVAGRPVWHTVERTLTGRRIEAPVQDPEHNIYAVCTMILYIRTGDRTYRPYVLSGGP